MQEDGSIMFWGDLLCEFCLCRPRKVISYLRGFPHHSPMNFYEVKIKQGLSSAQYNPWPKVGAKEC